MERPDARILNVEATIDSQTDQLEIHVLVMKKSQKSPANNNVGYYQYQAGGRNYPDRPC